MKTTAYQIAFFATLSIAALGSQAQSKIQLSKLMLRKLGMRQA